MLTAEDAHKIKPLGTAKELILSRIEDSVRRRMQTGLDHMIDVTSLVPHPHLAVVMAGSTDETLDEVIATLGESGYGVQLNANGRHCLRISW